MTRSAAERVIRLRLADTMHRAALELLPPAPEPAWRPPWKRATTGQGNEQEQGPAPVIPVDLDALEGDEEGQDGARAGQQ